MLKSVRNLYQFFLDVRVSIGRFFFLVGNLENAAHPNTVSCTVPTDEAGENESSSSGSVIRVPIIGGEEEGEDEDGGYSSSGSVIRVSANEIACSSGGSLLGAPVGSIAYEGDGYSSDDSVVRVPVSKASFGVTVEGQGPNLEGIPRREAEGLGLEKGPGYQDSDENGITPGKTGQAPAHMKMNLLAASKYFGSRGGASDGGPGAATDGQRNGSAHLSQREDDNPQVRICNSHGSCLELTLRLAHMFAREPSPSPTPCSK